MYKGWTKVVLENDEQIAAFYENKINPGFKVNEYILLVDRNDNIIDKRRWLGETSKELSIQRVRGLKTRSFKQDFLCDLLSNLDIPIRLIGGCAGAAKTFLTMRYAFHFIEKGKFQKILLVRHNVSVGEKNGMLPGDKIQKIRGWLGFFEDNLDSTQYTIDDLIMNNILEVDSVEYMKGRDLKNMYIILDEAEDVTCQQFRMLGERVSSGSVINICGDYDQVTTEKYSKDNGLLRAFDTLSGNPKVGIVVFDDKEKDNMRSEVSKIFSYLY